MLSWRNAKIQTKGETFVYFDSSAKCVVTVHISHYAMSQDRQESHIQSCTILLLILLHSLHPAVLNGLKHIAIQPILASTVRVESVKSNKDSFEN